MEKTLRRDALLIKTKRDASPNGDFAKPPKPISHGSFLMKPYISLGAESKYIFLKYLYGLGASTLGTFTTGFINSAISGGHWFMDGVDEASFGKQNEDNGLYENINDAGIDFLGNGFKLAAKIFK